MKPLRLVLAAAAVAAAVLPAAAQAGNGCSIYTTHEQVAPGVWVDVPHCAW
ncbi:MAG TPA: hypothetical protein VFQ85_19505 [Mycobacteriales bacterium]|jgi:ABC-type sugar transport system substrate-binding protein|nr:hypothetical protein [Mycobacteriales bacterium]